jgi:poly(3-hydroxybutyrate) depolymerase
MNLSSAVLVLMTGAAAPAADLPTGQVIAEVKCEADPSQSYALYLPLAYTADRPWPVIFAFDPGGRGRNPVDRYQAAAEQYGFIVAGSNNSRNGSPDTAKVVAAMTTDVASRFQIDAKRVYMAGMSGGARIALLIGLGSPAIAGVIASSAGYPDARPRNTLSFPLFATAGTEDFNHLEMRLLDRALTSPHRLVIFEGGHMWLSSDLAVEAVEWMELQAMKARLKPRDDNEVDRIFAKRGAGVAADNVDTTTYLALQALVADFDGLRDVSSLAARAAALGRDKRVRAALKKDTDVDDREQRMLDEVRSVENRLTSDDARSQALLSLRQIWSDLSEKAKKPEDSAERRLARRVLANLSASVTSTDPDYLEIIAEYRTRRGRR